MRIVLMYTAVLGIFLASATLAAEKVEYPPQAAPVMALFAAVKESDVDAFRNVYSERIRKDESQGNWEDHLKQAQGNLEKMYGDFQLSEFNYSFDGDEEQGKVSVAYKQAKPLELGVIKEGGEWKVDMR